MGVTQVVLFVPENQMDLDEFSDEDEVRPVEGRTNKRRVLLGLVVVGLVFVGLFVCASMFGVGFVSGWFSNNNQIVMEENVYYTSVIPDQNEETKTVTPTEEYQLVLDMSPWIDRDAQLTNWVEQINQHTQLNISLEDVHQSVREQYYLSVDNCGTKHEFRVRDYLVGTSGSTIDIKSSGKDQQEQADEPFWPSASVVDNSAQKLETDYHECETKFSRETRIFSGYTQEYLYCIDLLRLYPWAFEEMTTEELWAPITRKSSQIWWMGKIDSQYDLTHYQMEWTLMYNSLENAASGSGYPSRGEFSIRLYSHETEDGFVYETPFQQQVQDLWHHLMEYFGNFDDC